MKNINFARRGFVVSNCIVLMIACCMVVFYQGCQNTKRLNKSRDYLIKFLDKSYSKSNITINRKQFLSLVEKYNNLLLAEASLQDSQYVDVFRIYNSIIIYSRVFFYTESQFTPSRDAANEIKAHKSFLRIIRTHDHFKRGLIQLNAKRSPGFGHYSQIYSLQIAGTIEVNHDSFYYISDWPDWIEW